MKKTINKYVITEQKLKRLLGYIGYKKYLNLKNNCKFIDKSFANFFASKIKKWAIKNGATSYSHCFFPLNNKMAQKYVSFLDFSKNKIITSFSGKDLIKTEADASSFPSGDESKTCSARGYVIWDITSKIFIYDDLCGNKTLCIPSIFLNYNGVALDYKIPLIKSLESLNKQGCKLLHNLGIKASRIDVKLGIEQEYFLIEKSLFEKRKDLVLTGKTLFGESKEINQAYIQNYYGVFDSKISGFANELCEELLKIGIVAKIQHKEVAPKQYEIVPVFCDANIANDQNIVMMNIMQNVASKYGLKVIFDEKPFEGINGSGKHMNWSIFVDNKKNLFDCSQVSSQVFLLIFVAVLSALDKYHELLVSSVSYLSNDCRVGGNEAPSYTFSVFTGDNILGILKAYLKDCKVDLKQNEYINLNSNHILKIIKDSCDRNRTSPFAFTGNKFEFRVPGSSQNCAFACAVLCTIVANEFKNINKKIKNGEEIGQIIKNNIKKHLKIVFNGDNYSKYWEKENKKRYIKGTSNCIDAYKELVSSKSINLFTKNSVMTKREIYVRYKTLLKTYVLQVKHQAKVLEKLILQNVLPVLNKCLYPMSKFNIVINKLKKMTHKLSWQLKQANKIDDLLAEAEYCRDYILITMKKIRRVYDSIDVYIPQIVKPFISYDELFV